MKKITLLLVLLMVSFGYSQDLLLGFESSESGGLNGGPFGNVNALQVNLVTDAGTNGTRVAEFIPNSAGEVWQGINIKLTSNVDLTSTQTMTMDVKSATPITFLVKVNGGVNGAPEAAAEVTHSGGNTWQTLSFTFNTSLDGKGVANGVYTSFVIHPYWKAGVTSFGSVTMDERTFYVDNLKGPLSSLETCSDGILNNGETAIDCGGPNCSACPSPPTVAAPTPPSRPSTDVISLYSDAYTNVASNFDAGWCGTSSVSEVMIANNATMHYLNNACQGIVLNSGIDASTFTYLHVDLYIQPGTNLTSSVFNLKFVQQPGGGALEINLNVASSPALVAGSWLSIDLPVNLANFTGFKEFGITSNIASKVWYDNLYVHKNTTLGLDNLTRKSFKSYPNPSVDSWIIELENEKTTSITIYDVLGKSVMSIEPKEQNVVIDGSNLKSGIYFAKIQTADGIGSLKLIKK